MRKALEEINTIVLVMMENRSFDHMLGHISLEDPSSGVNGLRTPLEQYNNDYNGSYYPCFALPNDRELDTDVPHEYDEIAKQLRKNPVNGNYTMQGFVEAYAATTGMIPNTQCIAMSYFTSGLLPITSFLAKNFCVCDNWFSSLPTSTQPNKTMAFTGDSSIYNTRVKLIPTKDNIFRWMDDMDIRWRVYHDGLTYFVLYHHLWPYVLGEQFKRYEYLYTDMLQEPEETTPQVIIVEPTYHGAPNFGGKHPNDNHAPLPVGWGEDFIRRTYQAITANKKKWGKTLMILYYDEHGGFYDHVPPPKIKYKVTGEAPYTFESLGPRIPAIVISPFVKRGSVCHELFDHTSVLQLLAEKFSPQKKYSPTVESRRKAGIKSVSASLANVKHNVSPPVVPSVAINVKTALGKTIIVSPEDEMGRSLEHAALQMMEKKPAETAKKYPELFQWKDAKEKART